MNIYSYQGGEYMPRGDGTGPMGRGARTGRGLGPCGAGKGLGGNPSGWRCRGFWRMQTSGQGTDLTKEEKVKILKAEMKELEEEIKDLEQQ